MDYRKQKEQQRKLELMIPYVYYTMMDYDPLWMDHVYNTLKSRLMKVGSGEGCMRVFDVDKHVDHLVITVGFTYDNMKTEYQTVYQDSKNIQHPVPITPDHDVLIKAI